MNIKYFFENKDGNLYLNNVLLDAIYIISPTSTENSVEVISAYDKNLSLLSCKIDEIQFEETPLTSVSQFRELTKGLFFKQGGSSSGSNSTTSPNSISETIWYDPNKDKFFVRKTTLDSSNNQVVVFTDLNGNATNATTGPSDINALKSLKETDYELLSVDYYASVTNVGSGYSIGDLVTNIKIINTTNNQIGGSLTFNNVTGLGCGFNISEMENIDDSMWNYQNQKLKSISENTDTNGILVNGNLQTVLNFRLINRNIEWLV